MIRSRGTANLIEWSKHSRFTILLIKFRCHLALFSLLFVCFVYFIANSKSNLQALKECLTSAGIDGKNIIQRDNGTEYKETNWQWNTANGYLEPMAYLVATDGADVQKAVICCQQLKIRLVPRSGGHSIVKNSFGDPNSLVIDLKRLNAVSVDPIEMSCEIGPGARAGLISYTLWKEGEFMIPTGICPTVGIGGLASGGGYGYYTRLFGLTSDNLLELEMIDAQGKVLLINDNSNEDLFWALRGGGGGSFGIITKFKFRIHLAPKHITYGIYQYKFDQFIQFYKAWQSMITSDLPNNIVTLTTMRKNSIEMEIVEFHLQNDNQLGSLNADFEGFLSSFNYPTPTANFVRLKSYQDFMLSTAQHYSTVALRHPSQLTNITRHCRVGMTKVKSIYVDVILDEVEISMLQVLLGRYLKFGSLHLEQNLGAVNNFTCSETAFIHRGTNIYHIQLEVFSDEKEDINLEAISAMNSFYDSSKNVLNHRESYQNYLDEDIPDYLERYYGANLRKLIQVKRRIDPQNTFHHPQSIPINFV